MAEAAVHAAQGAEDSWCLMEEKNEVILLGKEQVFELVQIMFDNDKDAALKFLENNIYKPIEKRKHSKCKKEI